MARNSGKKSEAIFEENVPGLVFRLRDKADLVGLNKGKNVAAFGNPSDTLLVDPSGHLYFAEVKSTTSKTSFSLSAFTKAQKSAIYRLHKRGYGHVYRIYIHSLFDDKWYLIDANIFMETIKAGKKSIKWQDLTTQISW